MFLHCFSMSSMDSILFHMLPDASLIELTLCSAPSQRPAKNIDFQQVLPHMWISYGTHSDNTGYLWIHTFLQTAMEAPAYSPEFSRRNANVSTRFVSKFQSMASYVFQKVIYIYSNIFPKGVWRTSRNTSICDYQHICTPRTHFMIGWQSQTLNRHA